MKNKLFSRLGALALAVAMLLPCLMTAPVTAAGSAVELFKWKAVSPAETNMAQISDNLRRGSSRTQTHYINSLDIATANGTVNKMTYYLFTGVKADYGLPYEAFGTANAKSAEGLRLSFNEFTPTSTAGLSAANVRLTYAHTWTSYEVPVFAVDALDVLVSKDGETWLEGSVGIRSWELIGHSVNSSGKDVFIYDIQTENLFDIDGFDPGDNLANIMLRPYGEYFHTYGWFSMADLTVNGYKTQSDWETAVPSGRSMTYVGTEKMREIVIESGYRIAETPWTADATFYSSWGALNGAAPGSETYPDGIPMRGPVYTRDGKAGYELWSETIVNGKYASGHTSANGFGMDCTSFAYDCYSRVSTSYSWVIWQMLGDPKLKLMGNLKTRSSAPQFTDIDVFPYNSEQEILESYALLEPGDLMIHYTSTGAIHIRVVSGAPKVARNSDGTIDAARSTILTNEQGSGLYYYFRTPSGSIVYYTDIGTMEDVETFHAKNPGYQFLYTQSTRPDWEYTFANMYNTYYVPLTLAEYENGMVEDLNFQSILLPKENDITKGFTATVSANYHIIKFDIQLLDTATGEVLYSDTQLGNASIAAQVHHQLYHNWYYDTPELDAVLAQLTNGSYRIAVSMLGGPTTEVRADRPTATHYYDFTVTGKAPATTVSVNAPASVTRGQTFTVPVNVSGDYAAADVEVKFDGDKLTYVSGTVTPEGLIRGVQTKQGIAHITLVDANATAGQLAQLTFTAKEDISDLASAFTVKSAQLSTRDGADANVILKGTDTATPCPSVNFADVAPGAWYHSGVDYVLESGIMSGYNATTFGPNDTLNRAMVVQILYNKEGQPATGGSHSFPDAKPGDWFNNAIAWANLNKIVGGYGDGRFGPNDKVTLEQIAVILWNYSGNPTPTGDAASLGAHSDWAANALSWAAGKGIFKNVPYDTVTGTATRAQTAQMLMNYLSK